MKPYDCPLCKKNTGQTYSYYDGRRTLYICKACDLRMEKANKPAKGRASFNQK